MTAPTPHAIQQLLREYAAGTPAEQLARDSGLPLAVVLAVVESPLAGALRALPPLCPEKPRSGTRCAPGEERVRDVDP